MWRIRIVVQDDVIYKHTHTYTNAHIHARTHSYKLIQARAHTRIQIYSPKISHYTRGRRAEIYQQNLPRKLVVHIARESIYIFIYSVELPSFLFHVLLHPTLPSSPTNCSPRPTTLNCACGVYAAAVQYPYFSVFSFFFLLLLLHSLRTQTPGEFAKTLQAPVNVIYSIYLCINSCTGEMIHYIRCTCPGATVS